MHSPAFVPGMIAPLETPEGLDSGHGVLHARRMPHRCKLPSTAPMYEVGGRSDEDGSSAVCIDVFKPLYAFLVQRRLQQCTQE